MRGNPAHLSPAFDLNLWKSDYVTIALEDLPNTLQGTTESLSAAIQVMELSWFQLPLSLHSLLPYIVAVSPRAIILPRFFNQLLLLAVA